MIRRGTTNDHGVLLPVDRSQIKLCRVFYVQDNVKVFHKDVPRYKIDGKLATVTLTEEETLKLTDQTTVQCQAKVLTNDDRVLTSHIYVELVYPCLDDEMLGSGAVTPPDTQTPILGVAILGELMLA